MLRLKRPSALVAYFGRTLERLSLAGDPGYFTVALNQSVHWHAARMTLYVSWACMGMLVRAVHSNVGRPELWVMLPTD